MLDIKVYTDIDSPDQWLMASGNGNRPFSAECVKDLFADNATETDFRFNFHCQGGSVTEGLAIYDLMRMSGKNIHCNIDGACHSMAVTLLLAAPFENRTANPNARALLHDVSIPYADGITETKARQMADGLARERENILAIYVDRTGRNREHLRTVLLEERERTAGELLSLGFISRINQYTTNSKTHQNTNTMSKQATDILNKANTVLDKISNFFRNPSARNYAFTDADGNTLFETQADTDALEVGAPATPDGTFELPDGRTVIVAEGIITEIIDPAESEELRRLRNRVANMERLLRDAHNTLAALRNTKSNYNARPRQGLHDRTARRTADELKNEIRENLNAIKRK